MGKEALGEAGANPELEWAIELDQLRTQQILLELKTGIFQSYKHSLNSV